MTSGHVVGIRPVAHRLGRTMVTKGYRAICSCGWRGQTYGLGRVAKKAASAHLGGHKKASNRALAALAANEDAGGGGCQPPDDSRAPAPVETTTPNQPDRDQACPGCGFIRVCICGLPSELGGGE